MGDGGGLVGGWVGGKSFKNKKKRKRKPGAGGGAGKK